MLTEQQQANQMIEDSHPVDVSLTEIFDAQDNKRAPIIFDQTPHSVQEKSEDMAQAESDMAFVRGNLYELIQQGTDAVDQMMQVARESQHPRTYEVLAGLIRTMGDMGDKLIQVHKSKQEITGTKPAGKPETTLVNVEQAAVFVGSTAELLKKIKEEKNAD
jgi:hypothetical protein